MKSLIITVIGAGVMLSSCSTYRSGQTPDDVYYSPSRNVVSDEYVVANSSRNEGKRYNNAGGNTYSAYDDFATMDDRWLMMRVRNRARWSIFDDYNFYSPYNSWGFGYTPGWSIGFGGGMYNPYMPFGFSYYDFNSYWNWNTYYNPYYPKVIVVNPKTNPAGYTKIRNFNLASYTTPTTGARTTLRPQYENSNRARYNNTNTNRTFGNTRRTYNTSNSRTDTYRAPSQDRPVRTYTPSTESRPSYTPSSSNSSGNTGSRPVRR